MGDGELYQRRIQGGRGRRKGKERARVFDLNILFVKYYYFILKNVTSMSCSIARKHRDFVLGKVSLFDTLKIVFEKIFFKLQTQLGHGSKNI